MKREKNKEYIKSLLIETAMELFRRQEYQKTTIDEIVKAAGVSKPTFFAYFKSKEQVLFEFDLQQLETYKQNLDFERIQSGNILSNLKESVVNMATKLHTTPMLTQNLLHLMTVSEEYKSWISDTFTIFRNTTKDTIEFGQQQKLITTDIRSEQAARDIVNIYLGSLVNWVIFNGAEALGTILETALDHYFCRISTQSYE